MTLVIRENDGDVSIFDLQNRTLHLASNVFLFSRCPFWKIRRGVLCDTLAYRNRYFPNSSLP